MFHDEGQEAAIAISFQLVSQHHHHSQVSGSFHLPKQQNCPRFGIRRTIYWSASKEEKSNQKLPELPKYIQNKNYIVILERLNKQTRNKNNTHVRNSSLKNFYFYMAYGQKHTKKAQLIPYRLTVEQEMLSPLLPLFYF